MTIEHRHSMGRPGICICPICEKTVSHEKGIPYQQIHCPSCGAMMLREGSEIYKLWKEKRANPGP